MKAPFGALFLWARHFLPALIVGASVGNLPAIGLFSASNQPD
jgi:hypothetical protein